MGGLFDIITEDFWRQLTGCFIPGRRCLRWNMVIPGLLCFIMHWGGLLLQNIVVHRRLLDVHIYNDHS